VNSTSRTHSDTLLLETPRDAAISARQAGAAQLACLLPLGELAPVAHGRTLP
jgi:hypothetical protein